jgi:hypothetical protein
MDLTPEQEQLCRIVKQAEEAVRFYSQKSKPKREMSVVGAFLRGIELPFDAIEVQPNRFDPPDVLFRDACFEVFVSFGSERACHREWKIELEKRKNAKTLAELMTPYAAPVERPWCSVAVDFLKTLGNKARKYGGLCSKLDLLVYINLVDGFLKRGSIRVPIGIIRQHGWRSVSIVTDTYSIVLTAESRAPEFLRMATGRTFPEGQLFL